MPLVLIAVGGATGAVSRFLVDTFVAERVGGAFPGAPSWSMLPGSFVLGLLFALAIERTELPAEIRGPVMIGFLGAYTTFSTLMLESWRLVEDGAVLLAAANLVGSSVVGIVAVVAGLALGRAFG